MKAYIYSTLGNLYQIKNNTEKAMTCFEKALQLNTKNIIAIYNYGIILLQNSNPQKAMTCFFYSQKILKKKLEKSKNARPHLILLDKSIPLAISSCYWRLNDVPKAIETLEKLRETYSYISPNALTTLGYFYFLNKDYDKALEMSNKAIEDTESFYSAWDNIGQVHFEKGDIPLAKTNFLKAIEYNPNSVDSLYHLGLIAELMQDKDEAIDYFQKAIKCNMTALNTVDKETLKEKLKQYNL